MRTNSAVVVRRVAVEHPEFERELIWVFSNIQQCDSYIIRKTRIRCRLVKKPVECMYRPASRWADVQNKNKIKNKK